MQRPDWLPDDIKLKSSPKRKYFGVKLNFDGSCELLVPVHADSTGLERAFRHFEPWIIRKRQQLAAEKRITPLHQFSFSIGSEHFLLGRKYPLVQESGLAQGVIRFNGTHFQTAESDPELIRTLLEVFYRQQTRRVILFYLEKACNVCNVNYRKLSITGARKRFGSCNSRGDLCFSWRLAMYPEPLIELVVWHELTHRSEMNHSARFYQLLASRLPDHRRRNQLLKQWARHLSGYPA